MKVYRILFLGLFSLFTCTLAYSASELPDFQDPKIFLPNAFSPNGDGSNDVFRPEFNPTTNVLNYDLAIYDRWGAEVFRTKEHTKGWDGWLKGERAPEGSYMCYLRVRYEDESGVHNDILSGEVILIR